MDLNRRTVLGMVGAGTVIAAFGALPSLAQGSRELVIVTYPGALSGPHRWLADRIEARHPGLRIRLVPSDSQDIVAQIKAAQGYVPYDAGPNDEPPHLIGLSEGYIAARDDAALPNLANALPQFVAKSQGSGVPTSVLTLHQTLLHGGNPRGRDFARCQACGFSGARFTRANCRNQS